MSGYGASFGSASDITTGTLPIAQLPTILAPLISPWFTPETGTYCTPFNLGVTTTSSPSGVSIQYAPILVKETTTFTEIGFEITSTATSGKSAVLGIYSSDQYGKPYQKIETSGTVSIDSGTLKTIVINRQLTPGLYYIAFQNQASITVRAYSPNRTGSWGISASSAFGSTYFWTETHTYDGTLPTTATPARGEASSQSIALTWLRY